MRLQAGISDEMYQLALKLIRNLKGICPEQDNKLSSILVFLPGIYEIGRLRNILVEYIES